MSASDARRMMFREALQEAVKIAGPDIKKKLQEIDESPIGHGILSCIRHRDEIETPEDALEIFLGAAVERDKSNQAAKGSDVKPGSTEEKK